MLKPAVLLKRERLTRGEILQLDYDLKNVLNAQGIKLNYAINHSRTLIKAHVEAFGADKIIPFEDGFTKYQEALKEAYKVLAGGKTNVKTTKTGEQENMDFDPNSVEAKNVRVGVREKFKKEIQKREDDIKAYQKWLDEECTVPAEEYTLHKITLKDIRAGYKTVSAAAVKTDEVEEEITCDLRSIFKACSLIITE
jgi:DNA repair ATPase RecN